MTTPIPAVLSSSLTAQQPWPSGSRAVSYVFLYFGYTMVCLIVEHVWANAYIELDRVYRFASNSRQLDCQSDSQEGHSRIAIESG